jgi:two-component system cell cycle sensor histidine kinase/response regulator CckA
VNATPALETAFTPSRDVLEKIVDNIPVMIHFLDESGSILFVNRQWERVLGWPAVEASRLDLLAECFPDAACRAQLRKHIGGEGGDWCCCSMRTRDHRILDTSWMHMRLLDGTIMGMGYDVTEHKRAEGALRRSEAQFRALTETSTELISIMEPDFSIRYVSPAVEAMLGYGPRELVGNTPFHMMHPEELARVTAALEGPLRAPGAGVTMECRMLHRDGSVRIIEGTVRNMLNVPGIEGIVLNARDITEQRQLEEQLRHAQKMEAIGQLAGGVAHEFANLLSIILCYTDLALKSLEPGNPLQADLEEIDKAAERGSELTSRLLTFSRRHPAQFSRVDLNEVVTKMTRMLKPVLDDRIEVIADLSAGLDKVKADPGLIEQVLLNLALNARDAMPFGGQIHISTATARRAPDLPARGRYVMLSFADSGAGMDKATRERIFEPFFTTKPKGKGTGLGLSTVYGIIRQHEGAITVTSAPGRGTTFRVYLPAA